MCFREEKEIMTNVFEAVESDDAELLHNVLAQGGSVEDRDEYGRTPIMVAALRGCRNTMAVLTGVGFNYDAIDSNGYSVQYYLEHVGMGSRQHQAKMNSILARLAMDTRPLSEDEDVRPLPP